MTDAEFIDAFESCRLAPGCWDHVSHVRMGWLYLRTHILEGAMARVRESLIRYNSVNGARRGYFETVTRAYLTVIEARQRRFPVDSWEAFRAGNPDLLDPKFILRFYSEARLFAPEARDRFLEPDLAPLE